MITRIALVLIALAACQPPADTQCGEIYERTNLIFFGYRTGGQRSLAKSDVDSPDFRARYVAQCIEWPRARRQCMATVKNADDVQRCTTY
jgi:hypothetical protein